MNVITYARINCATDLDCWLEGRRSNVTNCMYGLLNSAAHLTGACDYRVHLRNGPFLVKNV
jgi:hypothetical protein